MSHCLIGKLCIHAVCPKRLVMLVWCWYVQLLKNIYYSLLSLCTGIQQNMGPEMPWGEV